MKYLLQQNLCYLFLFFILSINAQITTLEVTLQAPCAALKLDNLNIDNFNIYPNPAQNKLYIDLRNQQKNLSSIKIYDVKGALVYDKKSLSKENSINLDKLKNGFYFLVLESDKEKITKKLIIQK